MSIRHNILKALAAHGPRTLDELEADIGEPDRKKLSRNLSSCTKVGLTTCLVDNVVDEETGVERNVPIWTITPTGRERLSDGPHPQGGDRTSKEVIRSARVSAVIDDVQKAAAVGDPSMHPEKFCGIGTKLTKKTAPKARLRLIDFNGGLVGDSDLFDEGEARGAAETHAREHGISVDVCKVIGTANFERVPTVTWSSE
jgi:hypothetical protein